jgi:hypothetical protein
MKDIRNLEIDEADLGRELAEQAAMFVYVAEQAVRAEADYKTNKLDVERLQAALAQKHRSTPRGEKEKAPTEKAIEEAVTLEPAYQAAQRELNALWARKEILRALRDGWFMRSSMLIQMAAKSRCELESLTRSTLKSREFEMTGETHNATA